MRRVPTPRGNATTQTPNSLRSSTMDDSLPGGARLGEVQLAESHVALVSFGSHGSATEPVTRGAAWQLQATSC
ncbi:MAG: hypothetical protein ACHQ4F_11325 [Candidatus Dormibacteria bacterium]